MMRGLVITLVIGGLAARPALAAEAASSAPPAAKPVSGCSIFDPVDVNKLPKAELPKPPVVTEGLAKRHAGWTPADGADAEIAVEATDSMAGRRTTVIAQRVGGTWRVSAVQDAPHARDHEPMPAPASKEAVLDPDRAKALDQVLDDKCFWSTPPILPNAVPAKGGGIFMCYDGIDTVYRVRSGTRLWYGDQRCKIVGLPARIGQILWGATLKPSFTASSQFFRR